MRISVYESARMLAGASLALLLLAAGAPAQESKQDEADTPSTEDREAQVAHLQMLVANVGHDDPRVRYAIRQALLPLGSSAIAALNGAKARFTDKHVRAFVARTVKAIKARRSRDNGRRGNRSTFGGGRDRRGGGGRFGGSTDVDIDKVAMDANLTWDQMDKVLPIIREVRKDSRQLWTDLMEAEGWNAFRDETVRKDLDAAMLDLSKTGATKLAKVLKPEQLEPAKRHLNPMADMMRRMNKRMKDWEARRQRRGDRNRGDRNRGERNRGERGERRTR